MATSLADILFAIIAAAVVAAQALILRSTARGMRHDAGGRSATLEWTYAVVPALALALLLAVSWRAMHPASLRVEGVAPAAGIRS